MKVRQLINDLGNPAINQIVVEEGGKKIFYSYGVKIAVKKNGEITLGKKWDYSKTTMKHLCIFLRDDCHLRVYGKADVERKIKEGMIKLTARW